MSSLLDLPDEVICKIIRAGVEPVLYEFSWCRADLHGLAAEYPFFLPLFEWYHTAVSLWLVLLAARASDSVINAAAHCCQEIYSVLSGYSFDSDDLWEGIFIW